MPRQPSPEEYTASKSSSVRLCQWVAFPAISPSAVLIVEAESSASTSSSMQRARSYLHPEPSYADTSQASTEPQPYFFDAKMAAHE